MRFCRNAASYFLAQDARRQAILGGLLGPLVDIKTIAAFLRVRPAVKKSHSIAFNILDRIDDWHENCSEKQKKNGRKKKFQLFFFDFTGG